MEESKILQNLNEEQRLPAEVIDGAVLVTAGAGSGKTRMLTHRIAHMVSELGINPNNILAITFTNKAANEMKERLGKMIDTLGDMWICTFHAMCSRILRSNINLLGYSKSFSIYGDTEKSRVIKRILENKNTEMNAETFAWHISNAKNNLLSPDEYSKYIHDKKKCEIITKVYKEYENELFKSNALDFDDLLVKTYELFKKNPDTLEYYQNRFKYIFVDEFQDTNTSQYELVKLISNKYKNVFAVGDEDQCIYSWRGAQVGNVKSFTKDYDGCKVFKLEQNYRSTKKIIDLANKVIKNNTSRIEKKLWTANSVGEEIELKQAYNDIEEAEFVAEKIETMVKNEGKKYSDFAILMRVNSLSRIVEEKLLTYNIPYKVYGGYKFFERKEIKDTTSYLYLIANPSDTEAAMRMLSFPKKGIGDVSIAQISDIAESQGVSLMSVVMNASQYGISGSLATKLNSVKDLFDDLNEKKEAMELEEFVDYLIKKVGIKEAIGTKTEDDLNKCLNVDDLLKSVSEYAAANKEASIDDFLQSITLMRDIDSMSSEDDFVSLITVHAAKGLEFNSVFIVGLNDGLFPLSRAINSTDPNELEEERRLMYVAITRAKERLFLSRSKIKFNFESKRTEYTMPSRFLSEMFDNFKASNANSNGNIQRTTLYESGFDTILNGNKKSESLDSRMSSRVNIVNVSGKQASTISNSNSSSNLTIPKEDYSKFKKGTRVRHNHFGEGIVTLGVTDFASAFVTIKFDNVGIKTLSLKYAKLEIVE
jgi:DNA helicase-2/ATP-dependent DNA helicase PcrA